MSRSCDRDIQSSSQSFYLTLLPHASVDERVTKFKMFAVSAETLANLNGEFTRWCQNQYSVGPRRGVWSFVVELITNWQSERQFFAHSRLRTAQNLLFFEGRWNCLRLNGSPVRVILFS